MFIERTPVAMKIVPMGVEISDEIPTDVGIRKGYFGVNLVIDPGILFSMRTFFSKVSHFDSSPSSKNKMIKWTCSSKSQWLTI
jgi:hypothetical protein